MQISGVEQSNHVSMLGGQRAGGMNPAEDSQLKSIQNQIAEVKKQMQELSQNKDMMPEEKMKKKKELQEKLGELNKQLTQREMEIQREKREEQLKKNQEKLQEQAQKKKSKEEQQQAQTIGRIMKMDGAMEKVETKDSVRISMEGRKRVLEGEIHADENYGADTSMKEKELSDMEGRLQGLSKSMMKDMNELNQEIHRKDKSNKEEMAEVKRQEEKEKEEEKKEEEQKERQENHRIYMSIDIKL